MKKMLFLALLTMISAGAYAQPLITATVPSEYCPGETIDITLSATGIDAIVSAIGGSIWTPTEWGAPTIVAGSADATAFRLTGTAGLTSTGWIPSAGVNESITYRYTVPADSTGTAIIATQGEWRGQNDNDRYWTVITDHQVAECPPPQLRYHSADTSEDYMISLSELLRVIQLFNIGSLHCDGTTPDGYNPGPGDTTCTPHDSDYIANGTWGSSDWSIALTELLRLIQIFNLGGYHYCPLADPATEDSFCVGL